MLVQKSRARDLSAYNEVFMTRFKYSIEVYLLEMKQNLRRFHTHSLKNGGVILVFLSSNKISPRGI